LASVELKDIRKSYAALDVIHGISLDIADGEFIALVGPSGCGKSTLLRMIAGLEEITDGDIHIGGTIVNGMTPRERNIAMVFQSYALYPHMTVAENMGFNLKLAGQPKNVIDERVAEAARMLDLGKLLDRKPSQLSGGQRQRVAIGRAIVREPQVFLFDEPLSNLDAELRVQMRVEISRLHKQLGTTMIYVTHDQTEAMTLADKIVVLRSGNIEQVGAPLDLYDDPTNRFVAGFVGSPKMNFLDATVIASGMNDATVALTSDPTVRLSLTVESPIPEGTKVALGIRPEHFTEAGSGDADLQLHVDVAEHLGNTSYVYAGTAGGEPLIVERPESRDVGKRDQLTVGLMARKTFLFDSHGARLR